jgi:hypothetical protein
VVGRGGAVVAGGAQVVARIRVVDGGTPDLGLDEAVAPVVGEGVGVRGDAVAVGVVALVGIAEACNYPYVTDATKYGDSMPTTSRVIFAELIQ